MAGASSAELILRLVFSLGIVFGLMVIAARLLQRSGGLKPTRGASVPLQVIARQGLGRRSSVAVLSVGDRALVVGVGDDGVRLLGDLDLEEVRPVVDAEPQTAPKRGALATAAGLHSGLTSAMARRVVSGRKTSRPPALPAGCGSGRAARPSHVVDTLREWTVRRPPMKRS